MCDRIQQYRTQAVALPRRLAFREPFDGVRALNRDRDQTAGSFETLTRQLAAGNGQGANASNPHSQGHVTDAIGTIKDGLAAIADCLELVAGEQIAAAIIKKIDLLLGVEEKSGPAHFEGIDDVFGNQVQEL